MVTTIYSSRQVIFSGKHCSDNQFDEKISDEPFSRTRKLLLSLYTFQVSFWLQAFLYITLVKNSICSIFSSSTWKYHDGSTYQGKDIKLSQTIHPRNILWDQKSKTAYCWIHKVVSDLDFSIVLNHIFSLGTFRIYKVKNSTLHW